MTLYVLDTSALVRLFVPDGPLPDGLESALDEAWRAEANLYVPELALAEMGQVLRKKEAAGYLGRDEVEEILDAVLDLPLHAIAHRELLAAALELARQRRATVYDALFVVLAASRDGVLITADEEQRRIVDHPG